ncbi:otoancorin-like [Branchiostoma lanceolatum]|uniref:otoancorin-like n=1 Tax=Branchiostoma lanceolatum TaxID=7740 RepID=UPI0034569111
MAPTERILLTFTLILLQVITSNQQAVVLPTVRIPTAISGSFTSRGLDDQAVARAANRINWRSRFYRFLQGGLNGDELNEDDLAVVEARLLAALKQPKLNDISAPALRHLLTSADIARDVPSVVYVLQNIDLVKFFDILQIAASTSAVGQGQQPERSVVMPVDGLPISTPLRDAILKIGMNHMQGNVDEAWQDSLPKLSPYLPGITVGHVNRVKESDMVAEKLLELLQNVRPRLSGPVRANVVRYFKRVKAGNWSTEENVIQSLGVFVGDISLNDVENITIDTWKLVFNSHRLEDIDPTLARGILDKLLYANVTVTEPISNVQKLGKLTCVLPEALGYKANSLSQDVWRELARVLHKCNIGVPGRPGNQLSRPGRKLAQRIAKSLIPAPTTASVTDLRNVGPAIVGLSVSDLRELQARSVFDAISELSQAQGLSRAQAQTLLEKYVDGKRSAVTTADLSRLGNIAAAVDSATLAQFGQQGLQGSLSTLIGSANGMIPAQRKAIVKKIVGNSPDRVVNDLGPLISDLSLGSVTNVFPSEQDIPSLATLPWNQAQAANLIKRIKETRQLTPTLVGTLGTLLRGIRCPDMDNVALQDIVEVAVSLYDYVDQLPRGVRVCLANATQVAMNITLKHGSVTGSTGAVTTVPGHVIAEMRYEILASIPRPDCSDAFRKIGKLDMSHFPIWYQRNVTELALTCLGKQKSQQYRLDATDVDVLGKLLCHIDDFFKITEDAVLDAINILKECQCFSYRQREAVKDLIKTAFGNNARWWTAYELGQAGPLLHLLDGDIQRISQDALLDAIDLVLPVPQDNRDIINANRSTDRDCLAVKRNNNLYKRVITAVARGRTSPIPPRNRRQTLQAPLLCDQVQLLGGAVVQLSEQQVTYMDNREFLDCLEVFGAARSNGTDWDNYMLRILKLKTFNAAGGTVQQLTPDLMARVGRIAVTFSPGDLAALNYGNIDSVYGISKHSNYTKQQLEAAFRAFLNQNGNDVSALTERQLIGLGNFLCGMTTSQVSRINLGAFSDAVRSIGLLTDCDDARLSALRGLAGKLYGGPNTWGQDTILDLGVVAAGLSSSELSGLHEDRLRAITPLAISIMDPNKFKSAFSVWRIGRLGPSQAMAVTDKQLRALSRAQRDAVSDATLGQNGNTASLLQANMMMMVICLCCALR